MEENKFLKNKKKFSYYNNDCSKYLYVNKSNIESTPKCLTILLLCC